MDVFQGCGAGYLQINVDNCDVINVKFTSQVKVTVVYSLGNIDLDSEKNLAVLSEDDPKHSENELLFINEASAEQSADNIFNELQRANEDDVSSNSNNGPYHFESVHDDLTKTGLQHSPNIMHCEDQIMSEDSECIKNTMINSACSSHNENRECSSTSKDRYCQLDLNGNNTELSRWCGACSKAFDNSFEYVKHAIVYHATLLCADCGKTSELCHMTKNIDRKDGSESDIVLPRAISNQGNNIQMSEFSNQEIDDSFLSISTISTRSRNKRQLGRKCGSCQKFFNSDFEFVKHQVVMHANLQCFDCGKECLCKAHFMLHDKSVDIDSNHLSKEELSLCPMCFDVIHSHIMSDPMNEGMYQCCSCNNLFHSCVLLTKHLDTYCQPSEKKEKSLDVFMCKFCEKVFMGKAAFLKHKRTQKISHVCDDCGFKTKSEAILSLHQHWGHIKGNDKDIVKQLAQTISCHICGTPCPQSQILKHIQSEHVSEYPYKCCVCGSSSMTEIAWLEHAENHLSSNREDDNSSSKRLISNLTVKRANSENNAENVSCNLCRQQFQCDKEMLSHIKNKTSPVECDICKTYTYTKAGSIVHRYVSHGVSPGEVSSHISFDCNRPVWEEDSPANDKESESIKCPCCPDSHFPLKDLFFHVMEAHTQESPFKCCTCDCLSPTITHFLDHSDFHLGKKIFGTESRLCHSCDLRFESKSAYFVHIKLHRIYCEQCKRNFSSKVVLDKHISYHHTSLSCPICGKMYSSKAKLLSHERMHKGPRRRNLPRMIIKKQCTKCGLLFRYLKDHMRRKHPTPTTKRYTCDDCGKQFIHQKYLLSHLFVHTNYRPYECDICDWKFKSEIYLKRHMATHFERKMISCEICGKKCATATNMRIHMRVHANFKLFQCEYCDQGFNYKQSLISHTKSRHKDKMPKN